MFQYQYTGGKPTNYTNTKGFTESTVNGTSTTVHDLSSGAQAVMINIHRSCGIADLYDILCIARFACGRIAYSDLTVSQQRRLGGKNNRMDAMRYMLRHLDFLLLIQFARLSKNRILYVYIRSLHKVVAQSMRYRTAL